MRDWSRVAAYTNLSGTNLGVDLATTRRAEGRMPGAIPAASSISYKPLIYNKLMAYKRASNQTLIFLQPTNFLKPYLGIKPNRGYNWGYRVSEARAIPPSFTGRLILSKVKIFYGIKSKHILLTFPSNPFAKVCTSLLFSKSKDIRPLRHS